MNLDRSMFNQPLETSIIKSIFYRNISIIKTDYGTQHKSYNNSIVKYNNVYYTCFIHDNFMITIYVTDDNEFKFKITDKGDIFGKEIIVNINNKKLFYGKLIYVILSFIKKNEINSVYFKQDDTPNDKIFVDFFSNFQIKSLLNLNGFSEYNCLPYKTSFNFNKEHN
jgi:hypothetical protein